MSIVADTAFITTLLLVFTRLSALFLLTPLFSVAKVPLMVKNVLLIAMAVSVTASLDVTQVAMPATAYALFLAGAQELFIGLLMAFGLYAAFGAFLFGGRVLDFQMGFGVANLIDPATEAQSPLIGTILNIMAVMTFFQLDGHHLVFKGFAYSLNVLPVGAGTDGVNLQFIVAQFGTMFIYGLMLVSPAVFVLLLLDVGLAVAARTMPQVNIFIVGLPLKIFVGLIVLALSLDYLNPLIKRIFESIFRYWEAVLR